MDLLNASDPHPYSIFSITYNFPIIIIVATSLIVIVITTALGNLLVCLALIKHRYLRTISNFLIGNLALSDFLLAITILPLSSFNECLGHWIFGQRFCNAWLIIDALCCTASLWNICIIAFDRFTATFYPLWYRQKRSAKQAAIYIALVWIISSIICLPPVLGWNDLSLNYKFDPEHQVFTCLLFETPSYVLYSACGSFYVPLLLTLFLYIRIFLALKKKSPFLRFTRKNPPESIHSVCENNVSVNFEMNVTEIQTNAFKQIEETNPNDRVIKHVDHKNAEENRLGDQFQKKRCIVLHHKASMTDNGIEKVTSESVMPDKKKNFGFRRLKRNALSGNVIYNPNNYKRKGFDQRETRATLRMAIIIGVFCSMWLGFFTIYLINGWCKTCNIPREVVAFFFWLGYLNSAANPILYTIFNHDFRKAFKKLMRL